VEIALEDASDKEGREAVAVEILEEPAERIDQRRSEDLSGADAIEHERTSLRYLEDLGEELSEVVHADALFPQRLGESVMLLFGPRRPENVVEEQLADVVGCEP
jgi:hypothetical protein